MTNDKDVSLKEKLDDKLEKGEIGKEEYDELMNKFEDLDILQSNVKSRRSSRRFKISGSKVFEGGEVEEPIKVSGKFSSESSLSCPSLKISGSASIDGDLSVVEDTKVSGSLYIKNTAKFGGNFKLSGKTSIGNSVYFTESSKISGKLQVENEIICGDYLKVSGKIYANQLRSSSSVKLSGKAIIEEDLSAEEFITSGGGSHIKGNLVASTVEIAKEHREKMMNGDLSTEFDNSDNVESIPELAKFVTKVVTKYVPMVISKSMGGSIPSTFVIGGNIEGTLVDISYTEVMGDVIADIIKIGPGVTIHGKIKYRESIEMPEDTEFIVEQL